VVGLAWGGVRRGATMTPRDASPAEGMDPARSPLTPLVAVLAESEDFCAFADDFPAAARVSDAALPLVLAALHETRGGEPLLALFPEDEQARDAAEAVAWYVDPANVALLPSRGIAIGSGLEPPAHLVGERARALDVLASGGFVAASARALAEGLPPEDERPAPIRVAVGEEIGLDELVEQLALAGYERVDRVEERGQIAVRGGLVDVFPSTGREPLRIELFGDEIEQV
jgi:transcription-repair coupling factor (superfamily II helicase)